MTNEASYPEGQAERELPHSIEAEMAVLGSLMISPDSSLIVSMELTPQDFYPKRHQIIFRAMQHLHSKKQPIDLVTVSQLLKDKGQLDNCGGRMYITDLGLAVATTANAGWYAETIREKAFLRNAISFFTESTAKCFQSITPAEIIQRVQDYGRLATAFSKQSALVPLGILLDESIKRIEKEVKEGITPGMPTGFPTLTAWLCGFQLEEFIVLAATTGMGKTTIALKMALVLALNNIPTAFFSYEMNHHQILLKILAERSNVFLSKLRSGTATEFDIKQLWKAREKLIKANLFIARVFDEGSTTEGIRQAIRDHRARGIELKVIYVDYLQLLESKSKHVVREQAVNEIARDLKRIALEEHVTVIALAQVNEDVKNRASKRPELSDIRESGAIKQHADVVLAIYREGYFNKEVDDRKAEILILKQRMGPTGKVFVDYSPERNEYWDSTGSEEPEDNKQQAIDFTPSKIEPAPMPPRIETITNEKGEVIVKCPRTGVQWVLWDEKTADKNYAGALTKYGNEQAVFAKFVERMDAATNEAEIEWHMQNLKSLTEASERWKANQPAPPPAVPSWKAKLGFKG